MDPCWADGADALQRRLIAAYTREGIPVSVHVDLTQRCDLRCAHCYLEERAPDGLSTADWREVFDDLASLRVLQLVVSGGEPLARPDLVPLLEHARHRRFGVILKSHGGLVTAPLAAALRRAAVRRVDVSLYGLSDAVHDGITGRPGSRRESLRGIALLRKAGLSVRLSCPVMAANVDEVASLQQWAAQEGLTLLPSPGLLPGNLGADLDKRLGLDEQGLARYVALERRLFPATGPGDAGPSEDSPLCGAALLGAYIGAAGEARPCSLWPEVAGDVRQVPFSRLWRESPVFLRARALRHGDRSACRACAWRGFCTPCAARSLWARGSALEPAPSDCRLAAVRAAVPREEAQ